jgi:hypothetical protein
MGLKGADSHGYYFGYFCSMSVCVCEAAARFRKYAIDAALKDRTIPQSCISGWLGLNTHHGFDCGLLVRIPVDWSIHLGHREAR